MQVSIELKVTFKGKPNQKHTSSYQMTTDYNWFYILRHWQTKILNLNNRIHKHFKWNHSHITHLHFDLETWPLTLVRVSQKHYQNFNEDVLPSYQVWSWLVKWFSSYVELKFSRLKFGMPLTTVMVLLRMPRKGVISIRKCWKCWIMGLL